MNKTIQLQDLGLKDYKEAWEYQEKIFHGILDIKIRNRREERQDPTPNYFILVEHPHVYTLGKSGDLSNLLLSEKQLEVKNATFYKINRGGDITYHGPGQIVGYPILDLENFFYRYSSVFTLSGRSHYFNITRIRVTIWSQRWRNRRLARCRNTLCTKNLCHGSSRFSLGYHAWICFKC